MLKQVFRRLKMDDVGCNYVSKNFNKGKYIFFTHELENERFYVILVIKIEDFMSLNKESLKALPYIFNMRKRYFKIPCWLKHAERILFFNRNGDLVKDYELIRRLYKLSWVHEFVYTKPFLKIKKIQIDFTKSFYDLNKKRLSDFRYPEPKNEVESKVYEISSNLDKSDLALGSGFHRFLLNAKECYDLSHELSHFPEFKKLKKLEDKFSRLKDNIERLKEIIEKREKIWPEWDLYLKEYLRTNRKKKNRYLFAFLRDLIPIPQSTISLFLSDVVDYLKDNFIGHKSLQKSLEKYNKLLKLADRYEKDLFDIEFPEDKLKQ